MTDSLAALYIGHSDPDEAAAALSPLIAAGLAATADGIPMSSGEREARVEALIAEALNHYAREGLRENRAPLGPDGEARLTRALRDQFIGLGRLQPLLTDDRIETININGHDQVFVRYCDGTSAQVAPIAESDEHLVELISGWAGNGAHERRFDFAAPELSMQLPGGQRLHALMSVTDRVSVSIRRNRFTRVGLDGLAERGELTPALAGMLAAMVRARRNILVCGGPAVGKTTLLRALCHEIPRAQRLFVVEDAYELNLSRHDHSDMVVAQTREPNIEGVGEFDIRMLIKASLRMAPDRIIVGECRDASVVQMMKAMTIGLDGSMATIHASSSQQALLRLVAYAMEPPASYSREAALALIGEAVHVVVHLDVATDGVRVVSSIREITGSDAEQVFSNEVYRPGPDRRALAATPLRYETAQALAAVGFDAASLECGGW